MANTNSIHKRVNKLEKLRVIFAGIIIVITIVFALFVTSIIPSNLYINLGLLALILILAGVEMYFSFRLNKVEQDLVYKNLYIKTLNNFDNLSNTKFNLEHYSGFDEEFDALNRSIRDIEEKYSNIIFFKKMADFSNLKLDYQKYSSQQTEIITKDSFVKNIPNFVDESFAFRNAFFTVRFNEKDAKLNLEEALSITRKIKEVFAKNNVVVGYRDEYSLFVFVRNIDSLESLDYLLSYFVKDYHSISYSLNGNECYTLKVSAVVYPYSSEKEILNDLYYVNKKSNPVDIFIPNRISEKKGIESQVERLSYLSKISEEMLRIGDKIKNETDFKEEFLLTLKAISTYFDFDASGFIENKYLTRYEIMDDFSKSGIPLFKKGEVVNDEAINAIIKYRGKDESIYFTNRINVNPELAKYLDTYHISSGFFYVIYLADKPRGIIYFVNHDKEIYGDFLDRELLFFYSLVFRSYYNELILLDSSNDDRNVLKNLLKITEIQLYSIKQNDYKLINISDSLKSYRKDARVGMLCYKALYNLDSPCKDCPLKTNHSKESTFGTVKYNTSLKLTDNKEKAITMLMEPIKKDELIGRERFDSNLFINNYYPFLQSLNNRFDSKSKGYVVLCRIDNAFDVLTKVGEVNYNIMVRDALRKASEVFNLSEIYLYNANTLGFIFNEIGLGTIYDNCELINHFIKHLYNIEGVEVRLIPNIFIYSYPLDFDNVPAYVRYIETNLTKVKPNNENKLYAVEQHIERYASKTDYTLSLLEKAYSNKNFDLDYLPVLNKGQKNLNSAIVSLKCKDDLRGSYINNDDVMDIIKKENKMLSYTLLIIEEISNAFNNFDPNAFRISGLDQFIIKVDSTLFSDQSLYLEKLANIVQSLSLPQGFITFILSESDFAKNLANLTKVPSNLKSLGIKVALNRYSGNELPLSKLNELGIREVELNSNLLETLVDNATNLSTIQKITNEAKAYNIEVIAPSITNKDQEDLLKDTSVNYVSGDLYEKAVTFSELTKVIKNYKK